MAKEVAVFDADEDLIGSKNESDLSDQDYIALVHVIVMNSMNEMLVKNNSSSLCSKLFKKEKYSDNAVKQIKEAYGTAEGILSFTGKFRLNKTFQYFYLFKPDKDINDDGYTKKADIGIMIKDNRLKEEFSEFYKKYEDIIK